MNEVYFKQKLSKLDKSGRAPIFLEFNHDAQTLVLTTGEKCKPSEWDANKQKFRRLMPGYQEANESLQVLSERVTAMYRKLRDEHSTVSSDQLRDTLRPQKKNTIGTDLLPLFEDWLSDCRLRAYKSSTLKSMGVTFGRLRSFQHMAGRLSVMKWTIDIHSRFLTYLIATRQLHPNSVANSCKHLRAFFGWCSRFRGMAFTHAEIRTEWVESDRVYLTEHELNQLKSAELSVAMARVRDVFVFQCLTGLRYTELARLQHTHIEQRIGYQVLSFIAEKSVSARVRKPKRVEVPILPGAAEILERYKGAYRLLPVLSNQKMNDYVKDVAKAAGISSLIEQIIYEKGTPTLVRVPKWELISSHVARHTYATLTLMKGVPLEIVSKALGHSDLKTTMIYAKVVDEWKNQTILKAWQEKAVP